MIGATGSPEQIAALTKAFGAGSIKLPKAADGRYSGDRMTAT